MGYECLPYVDPIKLSNTCLPCPDRTCRIGNKCPSGTCRLKKKCICPDEFLESPSCQGRCEDSFSTSQSESIDREDESQQSCKENAQDEPEVIPETNGRNEKNSSSSEEIGLTKLEIAGIVCGIVFGFFGNFQPTKMLQMKTQVFLWHRLFL